MRRGNVKNMGDIKDFNCTYDNSAGIRSEVTEGLGLTFPDAYTHCDTMVTLSKMLKEKDKAVICELPFCHTLEAEAMGGIINIILDPLFIFVFKLNVTGPAIATFISNLLACIYFIVYLIITRKTSILNFSLKNLKWKDKVIFDIISSGLSSFFLSLMALFSNASINKLMSSYSASAISGVNIAKKVDLCIIAFAQGFAQGILPLIGYNFAAKNDKRMKKIIRFSMIVSITFAGICVILFSIFPKQIVSIFIKDEQTVTYASNFLRILCISMPPYFNDFYF